MQEPARARRYLEEAFGSDAISIYWGSAEDFVKELNSRWTAVHGTGAAIGTAAGG